MPANNLQAFFETVLGSDLGYLCLARIKPPKDGFEEVFFRYPQELGGAINWIEQYKPGYNLYFCPQVILTTKRTKTNIGQCNCLWSDLDAADPVGMHPKPSIVVESSPKRFQAYWLLKKPVAAVDAELYSKRIAYAFRGEGADISGWDLTQLLRIPGTYNYNRRTEAGDFPEVLVVQCSDLKYDLETFDDLPSLKASELAPILPFPEHLSETAMQVLDRWRTRVPGEVLELFYQPPPGDWSAALWRLECRLLESGLTITEAYIICNDAACNKFRRDGKDPSYLWKDVCRALSYVNSTIVGEVSEVDFIPLLSDTEKEIVAALPPTFVERYIDWATSSGDAAIEYHRACAFIILSGLLASKIKLPTSFGAIIPNLWIMNLGETTLTRKTTAMDMAMDLLLEITPEAMLATDGTLEGLLTALSTRPGQTSVFWRDEVSGLFDMIAHKDYYAGFLEMLTKLYDGKHL